MLDVLSIADELLRRIGIAFTRRSVIELNRPGVRGPEVALLVFVDGRHEPCVFIKVTSDAGKADQLEREFGTLALIEARGNPGVREAVPRPLFFGRLGGLTVFAESAAPGTRMKNFPPRRYFASPRFRHHLARVVRWLSEFHRSLGGTSAEPPSSTGADRLHLTVERFRRHHRPSPGLDGLIAESVERLEAEELPASPWHGDFCTANVVVPDDRRIFVIDWEYPLVSTWPLLDVIYFLSSIWCAPYRKGLAGLRANHLRLFFEEHHLSGLLRESMSRYTRQIGVDSELVLPLTVVAWMVYANRKQAALSGGDRLPEGHEPLIMIEDRTCLNLELLAENRRRFLFAPRNPLA